MNHQMHHSPEGAYVRSSDACPPGERARRLKSVARVMRREAGNTRQRADFMERHALLLEKRARALADPLRESSDGNTLDDEDIPEETAGDSSGEAPNAAVAAASASSTSERECCERRGSGAVFLASQARRLGRRALVLTAAIGSAVSAAASAALQRAVP